MSYTSIIGPKFTQHLTEVKPSQYSYQQMGDVLEVNIAISNNQAAEAVLYGTDAMTLVPLPDHKPSAKQATAATQLDASDVTETYRQTLLDILLGGQHALPELNLFRIAVLSHYMLQSLQQNRDVKEQLAAARQVLADGQIDIMYQQFSPSAAVQACLLTGVTQQASRASARHAIYHDYQQQLQQQVKSHDNAATSLMACQLTMDVVVQSHTRALNMWLLHWVYNAPLQLTDGQALHTVITDLVLTYTVAKLQLGAQQQPAQSPQQVVDYISALTDKLAQNPALLTNLHQHMQQHQLTDYGHYLHLLKSVQG